MCSTSAIAHYNAAAELEFLKMWPEALSQYEESRDYAFKSMGSSAPLHDKINKAIKKVTMNVRQEVIPKQQKAKAIQIKAMK